MQTRFRFLLLAAAALLCRRWPVRVRASAGERVRRGRQLRVRAGRSSRRGHPRAPAAPSSNLTGRRSGARDGRWIYEVKLIDERNRVHELELDAASGAVLEREEK